VGPEPGAGDNRGVAVKPRKLVRDVVLALALVALGVWGVTRFVAVPWVVHGDSMLPTLRPGDRVMVDLWSYRSRDPRPGEVALLHGPGEVAIVKRIAPPDRAGSDETGFIVLGDNPDASLDSRSFGAVPRDRFRGRVVWRYWPPSRVGRIP
jgi:nickel-type superoxide dismutase maturation protease